jgi:Ser/Thr protein kinase RdoA (MazF antagonist)
VAALNLGHRSIQRPLTAGRTNDSFRLVCTRGDFVLRRLREGKTAGALAFELDLIARLSAKGVPVAEAVATVDGDR